MKTKVEPKILGKNNGEIKAQFLDSSKAKNILNWKPDFGLRDGLEKTICWYKEFLKK